jgi:predicted ATPase
MAMDLFFSSCAVDRKRRVHFHKFLLEVHARVHAFKKDLLQRYGRDVHVNLSKERDPWTQIAKQIANESRLLCFDEFQVTDIADAVIMTKLFGVLWSEGVVLVATSNRTPGELYENGLNREYFLPFISMLEEQCVVFDMKSTTDYRKRAVKKEGAYFCPLNPEATQQMRLLFTNYDYAHPDGAEVEITEASKTVASNPTGSLEIRRVEIMNNRYIDVEAVGRSCWVSFRELCFTDRGAADYAALCRLFDCIFIDGIAKLNVQVRNNKMF